MSNAQEIIVGIVNDCIDNNRFEIDEATEERLRSLSEQPNEDLEKVIKQLRLIVNTLGKTTQVMEEAIDSGEWSPEMLDDVKRQAADAGLDTRVIDRCYQRVLERRAQPARQSAGAGSTVAAEPPTAQDSSADYSADELNKLLSRARAHLEELEVYVHNTYAWNRRKLVSLAIAFLTLMAMMIPLATGSWIAAVAIVVVAGGLEALTFFKLFTTRKYVPQ